MCEEVIEQPSSGNLRCSWLTSMPAMKESCDKVMVTCVRYIVAAFEEDRIYSFPAPFRLPFLTVIHAAGEIVLDFAGIFPRPGVPRQPHLFRSWYHMVHRVASSD